MLKHASMIAGAAVKIKAPGLVVVLSAPSGAGKSTLSAELMSRLPSLRYSVSYTTRPPRLGEESKRDYYFVTGEEFKQKVQKGDFLESAFVHNHWYGTPRKPIEENRAFGRHTLLAIDVQGGRRVKEVYPESVLVFLAPPNLKTLKERLERRRKDSPEVMTQRLQTARKELESMDIYDYLVINSDIREAAAELEAIVSAEERKISRMRPLTDFIQFKKDLQEEMV